jgi:hypothetical protein
MIKINFSIQDLIKILEIMETLPLDQEINEAELSADQKRMVSEFIFEMQREEIPNVIAYLIKLQLSDNIKTRKTAEKFLRFMEESPYTSPLVLKAMQEFPELFPHLETTPHAMPPL